MVGPCVRRVRGASAALVPLLACLLVVACGGGNAALVRGERRFEHCYRLDDDATVSEGAKLDCWRAWSAADGARDATDGTRVHYARERLRPRGPAVSAPSSLEP